MERPQESGAVGGRREPLSEPPPNPKGGRTLIVDARDPHAYIRPSAALKGAGETDQVFIRPGVYEDKVFVADRPVLLIGAGRDHVQIYSRRPWASPRPVAPRPVSAVGEHAAPAR